jgi:hypothetical protein
VREEGEAKTTCHPLSSRRPPSEGGRLVPRPRHQPSVYKRPTPAGRFRPPPPPHRRHAPLPQVAPASAAAGLAHSVHPPRAVQLLADADQVGQAGLQIAGQDGCCAALARL